MRDKKLSGLFCYILVSFKLKTHFRFIYWMHVIYWQGLMFLANFDTLKKRDFVTTYC